MNDDSRCCGSGTCLINAEGVCWCGQRWDGEKICGSDSQHQAENTGVEAASIASKSVHSNAVKLIK